MSEKMRSVVVATWTDLAKEKKEEIVTKVRTNTVAILNAATAAAGNGAVGGGEASAQHISTMTNKHDRARLLHIFVDPSFAMTWSSAHQTKDRPALDDRDNTIDYWGVITDGFNNYTAHKYINCTSTLDKTTGELTRLPSMETAYAICSEINPSLGLAVRPMRDSAWIKSTLREFKKEWAPIYTNYSKSGEQDGCDRQEEFARFYQGKELLMYAFVLFGETDMERFHDLLGKTLPEGASSDTGILVDGADDLERTTTPTDTRTGKSKNKSKNKDREQPIVRKIIDINVNGMHKESGNSTPGGTTTSGGTNVPAGVSAQDCMLEYQLNISILQNAALISDNGVKTTAETSIAELQQMLKRRRTAGV